MNMSSPSNPIAPFSPDCMAGRTAILVGGATLIGQAVASAFATAGAHVVIADIDERGGRQIADVSDGKISFIRTDITDDMAIDACLSATVERHGGVDFLINVATSYRDDGLQTSRADWLASLDVALVGGAIFAQKAAPFLIARRGAIVLFSSVSAHRAQAGRFVYPAAKAAVSQLTRSLALEFAPHGVRVNAVTPGWTWSNIMVGLTGDDRARVDAVGGEFHMMQRIADPSEVATAVLFLCSPGASFISGAELPVDGGYLAFGPERAANAIAALIPG